MLTSYQSMEFFLIHTTFRLVRYLSSLYNTSWHQQNSKNSWPHLKLLEVAWRWLVKSQNFSLERNLMILDTTWANICITWTNIVLLEWILYYLGQYYNTRARYHKVLPKLSSCKWKGQSKRNNQVKESYSSDICKVNWSSLSKHILKW